MKNSSVLFMFFVFMQLIAYNQIDTNKLIINAKLNLLEFDNSFISKKDYIQFINNPIRYDFLDSKGFSNSYSFFKIIANYPISNDRVDSTRIFFSSNNNYYFAVNHVSGKIYKLKGFKDNDFFYLYKDIKENSSISSLKDVCMDLEIDEIDLCCLASSYNNKGQVKRKKSSCLNYYTNDITISSH